MGELRAIAPDGILSDWYQSATGFRRSCKSGSSCCERREAVSDAEEEEAASLPPHCLRAARTALSNAQAPAQVALVRERAGGTGNKGLTPNQQDWSVVFRTSASPFRQARALSFRKLPPVDPSRMRCTTTTESRSVGREYLNVRSTRRPVLTEEQVYRLWGCAIKDDDKLIDLILERVYEEMATFDPERADGVMQLIIDRDEVAEPTFRALLLDIKQRNATGI